MIFEFYIFKMNTFVSTISRWAMAGIVHAKFIKEIYGWENIPKEGNFILASNHLSHIDWWMSGYIVTPRKFTFIAQVDQYTGIKKFWRNIFYWYGGIIPINRKSEESKKEAIETAIQMLKKGYCVVIYPEGGRAYDGIIKKFKPGVAILALESGRPVLPAAFHGSNQILPPHGKLKIKKAVIIAIGKPLDFAKEREQAKNLDKNSSEYYTLCDNITCQIETSIKNLLAETQKTQNAKIKV